MAFARMLSRSRIHRPIRCYYSVLNVTNNDSDLRPRLLNEIKAAMKKRDTVTSTTLRSVLSEINAAEKSSKDELSSSATAIIVRKAMQRRAEAASKFYEAKRPDLAAKEVQEAELLSRFLPPLLSSTDIDAHIQAIISTLPTGSEPRKSLGIIFKEFYSKVDKSTVDPNLVKQRAQALMQSSLQ